MGYTSEFDGTVSIHPPLNEAERSFLKDLAETRRMDRTNGPLFVNGTGEFGQGEDSDIRNYNAPGVEQPGLWLQWVPTEDGTALVWDGNEKFYHAEQWMAYLVTALLAPSARAYIAAHRNEDARLTEFTCNHTVNGVIKVQGEDPDDQWQLLVVDNMVTTDHGACEGTRCPIT